MATIIIEPGNRQEFNASGMTSTGLTFDMSPTATPAVSLINWTLVYVSGPDTGAIVIAKVSDDETSCAVDAILGTAGATFTLTATATLVPSGTLTASATLMTGPTTPATMSLNSGSQYTSPPPPPPVGTDPNAPAAQAS